MLRPLPLVTVRQQHGQATHPAPLLLAGGEELVDHHLSAVGEVTELGFPDGEAGRLGAGVAIFKGQYRVLGQYRVVNLERTLALVQVAQRGVGAGIGLVVQHGVAVEEGATAGVFTGKADAGTLVHQSGVGQGLGKAPIHQLLAGSHQTAIFVNLLDLTLQHVGSRILAHPLAEGFEVIHRHCAVIGHVPVVAEIGCPVDGVQLHRPPLLAHPLAAIQRFAILVDQRRRLLLGYAPLGHQLIGVDLARGRVLLDLLVHQGLGRVRLVGLVVTVTTVANQLDHHVTLEGVAIIQRNLGHQHHGFRVVTVDVQHRRLHRLGDVGAIFGGAQVTVIGGGETDLVVDDDTHRPAHAIGTGQRHVEGLGHHALTSHGRVTVDGDGQHAGTILVTATIHAGTHRADDHRVDDLEVRRVKGERQMDVATRGSEVGGEAHVVLHVARAPGFAVLAGKLVEQVLSTLAQHVDQHVEATAVGHTDNGLFAALLTGATDQLFQHGDHGVATFQREALGPRELGAQIFFQPFGGGQVIEEAGLLFEGVAPLPFNGFETLLQPALLLGRGEVHVVGADGAAIGLLQRGVEIGEHHGLATDGVGAHIEGGLHVCALQVVECRIQFGDGIALPQTERVQIGILVTTETERVDQLQYPHLLGIHLRIGDRRAVTGGILGQTTEIIADLGVGLFNRMAIDLGQLAKQAAPLIGYGVRIFQEGFVQILNVACIRTSQVR